MTQNELWDFIDENSGRGSVYGLDSMRRLLDKMDHPERKLKIIHIAGTNGKGSTLCYISSILKAAGYKTGTYSSPAVFDYREKTAVNGHIISIKALCDYMQEVKDICDEIVSEGHPMPTLFEMETALAFKYFADKECDFAVVECGLGGRDDATNIIEKPALCVFAKISMDHMQILGDSLEKIATAKSGIIKKGASVVSCSQYDDAVSVIKKAAEENKCSYHEAETPLNIKEKISGVSFDLGEYKKLETKLLGSYQPYNAATAVAAAKALNDMGIKITEKALRKGLLEAVWPGRFEVIGNKPLFIIDGAHNEDAAKRLADSIDTYLSGKPLIYICGVLADKEYDKVMALTADKASFIITITPPENKRALDKQALADTVIEYNKNVTTADSVEEAAEMAVLLAGQKNNKCAIVAFGSLSYLGRLKKYVTGKMCMKV